MHRPLIFRNINIKLFKSWLHFENYGLELVFNNIFCGSNEILAVFDMNNWYVNIILFNNFLHLHFKPICSLVHESYWCFFEKLFTMLFYFIISKIRINIISCFNTIFLCCTVTSFDGKLRWLDQIRPPLLLFFKLLLPIDSACCCHICHLILSSLYLALQLLFLFL